MWSPKLVAYLAAIAVIFATGFAVGARVMDAHWQHKWDAHTKADAEAAAKAKADLDAAVAKAHADERKAAKLSDTSTAKQVEVQTRIVNHTVTLLKEVPTYVTVKQDAVGCVTYGLERVLNAAITGASPAAYQLPAGKSDDDCTGTAPSALAAAIAENFGYARANAEQLNGLIEDVTKRIDIANGGPNGTQ